MQKLDHTHTHTHTHACTHTYTHACTCTHTPKTLSRLKLQPNISAHSSLVSKFIFLCRDCSPTHSCPHCAWQHSIRLTRHMSTVQTDVAWKDKSSTWVSGEVWRGGVEGGGGSEEWKGRGRGSCWGLTRPRWEDKARRGVGGGGQRTKAGTGDSWVWCQGPLGTIAGSGKGTKFTTSSYTRPATQTATLAMKPPCRFKETELTISPLCFLDCQVDFDVDNVQRPELVILYGL